MLHYEAIDPRSLELLKLIMSDLSFADFFLVGGTGLALQTGHRISDDLDLFSKNPFESMQLISLISYVGEVKVTGEAKNTLNCYVDGIKIDFIGYPYPLIGDLIMEDLIRIASVADIAAMKLSAIAQRGSKKDFFDMYELLQRYDLYELLDFFRKKFPSVDTFHILRSLTYFEDAETEKEPVLIKKVTWNQVKERITDSVKELSSK